MASITASSALAWAGQHLWLAERRRSPLAITITVSGIEEILLHREWNESSRTGAEDRNPIETFAESGRNELARHGGQGVVGDDAMPAEVAGATDVERHVEEDGFQLAAVAFADSDVR